LGWFIAGLGTFHTWEYIPTAMYRPNALGLDSFLLDHSWQYKFAMSIGFVEFLVELYFFPWMKSWRWFNHLGLFLLIAGQIARTVAQIHAGHNFDHLIQEYKSNDHVLVKTGIYRILRHPSYTGFFYWGIGMQLVLSNPICMVGYAAGLWYFFWDRIAVEEETLVRFFGEEYVEYRKKTWVLIPGI
ncbi:Isoprenylcysteine carboxyl methyltransferase family-domain-containing protein, partial [Cladochytrium replicatum]